MLGERVHAQGTLLECQLWVHEDRISAVHLKDTRHTVSGSLLADSDL